MLFRSGLRWPSGRSVGVVFLRASVGVVTTGCRRFGGWRHAVAGLRWPSGRSVGVVFLRASVGVVTTACRGCGGDRKSVVSGQSVSVRVYLGCARSFKKKY